MLIRISLIVAIVLALGVAGLNFTKTKEKITTLHANWKTEEEAHKKFETDYRRTKSELDKTNAVLKTTLETLKATGIDPNKRAKDLTDEEVVALRDHIEANYKVEGDLRREVAADIRRKVEIGCYEGIRHRKGLPVRGQRTRTNARTRKGPKRTVAGKKKAGKK